MVGGMGGGGMGGGTVESKDEKTDYNEICSRSVNQSQCKEKAGILRKAMKGIGTNEKRINEVIGPSSNAEIQAIREHFKTVDGSSKKERNLIKDFKSETSGNYENLLVALTYEKLQYDCILLRKAVKGMGTNETVLAEVLCTRTPDEVKQIIAAYSNEYIGRSLQTDIEKDTSGNLKKIYQNILGGSRNPGSDSTVDRDVDELYKAGEKRFGTNEKVFVELLSNRTRDYVEKLYWKYGQKYNKALDLVINKEFSGNLRRTLKALCTPVEIYFTKKLTDSMKGLGTKDDKLVRIIATQKERNLRKISKYFLQVNRKSLLLWCKNDTSGDYGKLMVSTCQHWANVA